MSDTPETDEMDFGCCERGPAVDAEFARKLERERDEARGLAEMYRNLSCETQCEAESKNPLPWDNDKGHRPDDETT